MQTILFLLIIQMENLDSQKIQLFQKIQKYNCMKIKQIQTLSYMLKVVLLACWKTNPMNFHLVKDLRR